MNIPDSIFTTDMYYKAIEGSDSGLWVYDAEKDLYYLSNRYYTMLGYSPGEFEGNMQMLFSLLHPDDVDRSTKFFAEFFASKSNSYRNEVRLKSKSGSYIDILTQGIAERDKDGKLTKFIGWNIDISSLKDAQRKLDEERARNMAQSRLAQLGLLAGGLAHEINNPLTVVKIRSELISRNLSQGKLDPKFIQDSLNEIQNSAKRIADIIAGLRAMSDGSADLRDRIPVSHVIEEVLSICRSEISKRGIDLHLDISQQNPYITANFSLMCQVLLNLINNAADALEEQTQKDIWIKTDADETHAFIIIEDNGPGIKKEDQDKIMLPFFTTKEPGKGTGLGLTISKSIVQSEKGDLSYEQLNEFTKFVVKLPLA